MRIVRSGLMFICLGKSAGVICSILFQSATYFIAVLARTLFETRQ